jgi:outer membrane immunogenic protein
MSKPSLLASTTLAGLLVAPTAFAADLAPLLKAPPSPLGVSWAGPYLGLSFGYAATHDPRVDCTFSGISPCTTFTFPTQRVSGPLGTFQAGYNWQVGSWVFGLESDISAMYGQNASQFPSIDAGKTDAMTTRYDWLGTVRGRTGFSTGAELFYVTGGYAAGRVSREYQYDVGGNFFQRFPASETRSGWTAGLGWEHALDQHLSLKLEYLYVHLSDTSLDLSTLRFNANGGNPAGTTVLHYSNNLNLVRFGMNLRF